MKDLKIRPVVRGDLDNLKSVVDSSELFPSEMLDDMIAGYLAGQEETIWLTGDLNQPTFIAYCAPEKMADGTWNLYLIAVHDSVQGDGIGKKILSYLENLLRVKGVRVLIIETSGLPEFESTRAFYKKCGYTEEARIRDFYEVGDDKVVYWKALQ